MVIDAAADDDLLAVHRLLERHKLPIAGVDAHVQTMLVARDGKHIVGHGATTVFLLTTTAERYFPKLGFKTIARDDVPASVQSSIEFQGACPASAIVMRKHLAND